MARGVTAAARYFGWAVFSAFGALAVTAIITSSICALAATVVTGVSTTSGIDVVVVKTDSVATGVAVTGIGMIAGFAVAAEISIAGASVFIKGIGVVMVPFIILCAAPSSRRSGFGRVGGLYNEGPAVLS